MTTFSQSDPAAQASSAGTWVRLGLEELALTLRNQWTTYLSRKGWGSSHKLTQPCSARSPLLPKLMETLLRVTSPFDTERDVLEQDDAIICHEINNGAPIGIISALAESPAWPTSRPKKRKRGECDHIRWSSDDFSTLASTFPSANLQDERLCAYAQRQIDEEIQLGRMVLVDYPPTGGAVSRCTPIWKDVEKTKVRLISDFRRSGINHHILFDRTVLYPAKREIFSLVADASDSDSIVQYDVKSAYRLLSVASEEVPFLTLNNPTGPGFLIDFCIPFGLVTSPTLWVRTNACIHKLQTRLLSCITGVRIHGGWRPRDKGFVYVDDSCWKSSDPCFCLTALLLIALVCGVRIEYSKIRISASSSTVLGFEIDLRHKTVTIPSIKKANLLLTLTTFRSLPRIPLDILETIIGKLSWIAQLRRAWKRWLAPLFATASVANKYGLRSIRPGAAFENSIAFFIHELQQFPGVLVPARTARRFAVFTDASLEGLGGVLCEICGNTMTKSFSLVNDTMWWFHLHNLDDTKLWQSVASYCTEGQEDQLESKHINTLELIAAVKGVTEVQSILAWDSTYQDSGPVRIHLFLDNLAMVYVINKWKSSSQVLQRLLSSIEMWEASVSASFIPSTTNVVCDFSSRNQRDTILHYVPRRWHFIPW